MTKALDVYDNTAQNQERQPQQQSGDKRKEQKLQGNALEVNENSVEDEEPAQSRAPPRRGNRLLDSVNLSIDRPPILRSRQAMRPQARSFCTKPEQQLSRSFPIDGFSDAA